MSSAPVSSTPVYTNPKCTCCEDVRPHYKNENGEYILVGFNEEMKKYCGCSHTCTEHPMSEKYHLHVRCFDDIDNLFNDIGKYVKSEKCKTQLEAIRSRVALDVLRAFAITNNE